MSEEEKKIEEAEEETVEDEVDSAFINATTAILPRIQELRALTSTQRKVEGNKELIDLEAEYNVALGEHYKIWRAHANTAIAGAFGNFNLQESIKKVEDLGDSLEVPTVEEMATVGKCNEVIIGMERVRHSVSREWRKATYTWSTIKTYMDVMEAWVWKNSIAEKDSDKRAETLVEFGHERDAVERLKHHADTSKTIVEMIGYVISSIHSLRNGILASAGYNESENFIGKGV